MPVPSYHLSLVVSKDGRATLDVQPIPGVSDYEMLVRVRTLSLTPAYWKEYDWSGQSGQYTFTNGGPNSFVGDIVAIGKSLLNEGWYMGQSLTGYCQGTAIQEYISISPHSYQPLHPNSSWLPYDAAPPMAGNCLCKTVRALHRCLAMPFELTSPEPFFVWDGSSVSGRYAIQLACLAGYKVVTTTDERSRKEALSVGAAATFDYSDPALVSRVRTWAREEGGGPLKKGLDALSLPGTIKRCMSILEEGGELVTLSPIEENLDLSYPEGRVRYVFGPPRPGDIDERECIEEWNRRMTAYLQSGKLPKSVVPLKVFRGGMQDLPKVVDFIKKTGADEMQEVVVTMP